MHSAVNGGIVIEFVERLVRDSRFDKIHIVVGNHDIKRRDGVVQLAYEFLRNKSNIAIYSKPEAVIIQSKQVLMLPHYITESSSEISMQDAYSALHESYKHMHFDLVVGHFMEESMSFGMSDTIQNIRKLKTRQLCLGHLHTRVDRSIYIGSVYANKINEGDPSRAAWLIGQDGIRHEDRLPIFCDYQTVKYPDPLPVNDALVTAYTITNCSSEKLARLQYGSIYIRKIIQQLGNLERGKDVSSEAELKLDPLELFKDFMKAVSSPLDRRVAAVCLASLKSATNLEYDNDRDSSEAVLQA